jgi:flagellar capping protein FliD
VASVSVTQGLAAQLGAALNNMLDPSTGQFQAIDQGFQQQLSTYATQVQRLQAQYNAQQAALETEFTNMETTLSTLKNTASFISAQTNATDALAGLTTSSSSSKSGG